jgi:hypothetical protein
MFQVSGRGTMVQRRDPVQTEFQGPGSWIALVVLFLSVLFLVIPGFPASLSVTAAAVLIVFLAVLAHNAT